MTDKKYYISSFFWSTLSKCINALVNFAAIPLLLGYFGNATYGVLALAIACNGYMHLLDLGINIGAVRFFSIWLSEKKSDLIERVARTNISFYVVISLINAIGLILLATYGRGVFGITDEEFVILKQCLYILAGFSIFSWVTTAFQQLLIADKRIAFSQQMQCIVSLLKLLLIYLTLQCNLVITSYFFYFTLITALLIVPYAIKAKQVRLINNILPGFYLKEFKPILSFSLALFALSIFQMTATQSRPLILGMCIDSSVAEVLAEFRIVEVIPSFIIVICGVFSSILLPKSTELISKGDQAKISMFAYSATLGTSIMANVFAIPFILSAKQILSAYVGSEYEYLSTWLIIWCLTVLIQIHTTPGNSLILANGKTKMLVYTSGIACLCSLIINILLANVFNVGSAIIAYFVYVVLVIGAYYLVYYKKILNLSRRKMLLSFIYPTSLAVGAMLLVSQIPLDIINLTNSRFDLILLFVTRSAAWAIVYGTLLFLFRIVKLNKNKIELNGNLFI